MKVVLLAAKLFYKRIFQNLFLSLQVFLSILTLAPMFVYICDNLDNRDAVNALPLQDSYIFTAFEYYNMDEVTLGITEPSPSYSMGRVQMYRTKQNGVYCNLVCYNDEIIRHYSPILQSGHWFSSDIETSDDVIPVVVSSDLGLSVGVQFQIEPEVLSQLQFASAQNTSVISTLPWTVNAKVIGVLEDPTQYLFPSGSASPEYFSASAIISNDSVIIIQDTDLLPNRNDLLGIPETNAFIFTTDGKALDESLLIKLGKYGEITPLHSLVSYYNTSISHMILSSVVIFLVFFFIALSGILSNNTIQSIYNKKCFAIYYMLGMTPRQGAVVEIIRVGIIFICTLLFSFFAGCAGALMLEWMKPQRIIIFIGLVMTYCVVAFLGIGFWFLHSLSRQDVSSALRNKE